jgi:membrane protein DedA with SNARE-associated domain
MSFFDRLLDLYASTGYWALFLGVMLENAGLPVPGETALLIAGHLASPEGGSQLNLELVLLFSFLAAVIGDNIGFWLGRLVARRRLARGRRFLFLTPERFRRVEGYFARYGAATVFFGRFVALLRIAAGPSAGAAGMAWSRFLVANAAGAAIWATAITLLGYYAGAGWETMHHWLGRSAWGIAALIAIVVVILWVRRWRRERKLERANRIPS